MTAPEKKCSRCDLVKPLSEFHFKSRAKGTRKAECRDCSNERYRATDRAKLSQYWRSDYERHHEKRLAKSMESNKKRRAISAVMISEAKAIPCQDCGNTFPSVCMDFDHRDPSQKIAPVSSMRHHSPKLIQNEIDKCDVVCANCHRIRTFSGRQQD